MAGSRCYSYSMNTSQLRPGRRLRIMRVTADLKQSELAERAGVHQTFISLLERGKCGATPETLGRIAGAVGCTVADLMPETEAA